MAGPLLSPKKLEGLTSPERDFLQLFQKLAPTPGRILLILFLGPLLLNLAFAAVKGWPLPSVHDEFSYLLAADTFAQGRLTNPTHPFSPHFETFHVLQEPSYASKYPPLPGAVLALGQIFGHPALGVFLVSALVIASVYWALRPLLSNLWSIFGSALAWAQFAPYSFYSSSYMGGGVSALGACLLFGAAARIVRSNTPSVRHSLTVGASVFILATSRPFEGVLVCSGIAFLLGLKFLLAPGPVKKSWFCTFFLPAGLVLLGGAAILGTYNRAVTGHSFQLPYSAYEATHSRTPLFVWGTLREHSLPSTPNLQDFEEEFAEKGFLTEQAKSFWFRFSERFEILLQCFVPFWFPSTVLLLLSAWSRNRWVWFSGILILAFVVACSFTVWFSRHYLGCLLPFLCLLACSGASQLCRFEWKNRPWGFHIFRLTAWSLFLLELLLTLAAPPARSRAGIFAEKRSALEKSLQSLPGQDLVLVSYAHDVSVHDEWVYNRADIDSADIVWAHSLGIQADTELRKYFSHRRVWRLQVDQGKRGQAEVEIKETTGSPN